MDGEVDKGETISDRTDKPILGRIVTETFPYDGGRNVSVYLPSLPPEAIVFAGDGQSIAEWGRDLEAIDVPPTMIVGVHGLADEMARLHEYSPVFEEERFAAHERVFVEEVGQWVRREFGSRFLPARTAVCGFSAGGELALALGLRNPEVYGVVLSGSPGGGYRPPDPLPRPIPSVYLVAGTLEPFFHENATWWATALHDAGADVVMTERVATHGTTLWRNEFPLMVEWAFSR